MMSMPHSLGVIFVSLFVGGLLCGLLAMVLLDKPASRSYNPWDDDIWR